MSPSRRLSAAALVLAIPLALGLAGCGDDDDGATGGTSGTSASPSTAASCALAPADPAAAPPKDIPRPDSATWYENHQLGATLLYFAYIEGDDVRQGRETAVTALTGGGFEVKGEDAEGNVEAEAELEGDAGEVRIQVIHVPDCPGTLRLRYIVAG